MQLLIDLLQCAAIIYLSRSIHGIASIIETKNK